MSQKNEQEKVRIQLTEEQKKQLREEINEDVSALEFNADELEERIAPVRFYL